MENIQFEIDGDEFQCAQCDETVKIGEACKKRINSDPEAMCNLACPKCGTLYTVGKDPSTGTYVVTEKTGSATEAEEIIEEELEDE